MANVKIVDNRSTSKAINNDVYETSSKKPKNNPDDLKNVVEEYLQVLTNKQEKEEKKNLIREEVKSMKKVTKFKDKFNDEIENNTVRPTKKKKMKKKHTEIHETVKPAETINTSNDNEEVELSPELDMFANMIVDGMVGKFVTRDEVRTLVEGIIQSMVMKNVGTPEEEDTKKE